MLESPVSPASLDQSFTVEPHAAQQARVTEWRTLWTCAVNATLERALLQSTRGNAEALVATRSATAAAMQQIQNARAAFDDVPGAWLHSRLGLSMGEETLLWTLVCAEVNPTTRSLLEALAQGEPNVAMLGSLAFAGDERAAWQALSPAGRLWRLQLIVRTDTAGLQAPEYRQTVMASRRLRGILLGCTDIDSDLADYVTHRPAHALGDVIVAQAAKEQVAVTASSNVPWLFAVGANGTGRRSLLHAARQPHQDVITIACRTLPNEPTEFRRVVTALARESLLLERTALFCDLEALSDNSSRFDTLCTVWQQFPQLGLLATVAKDRMPGQLPSHAVVVELAAATDVMQGQMWRQGLACTEADARELTARFNLAPSTIARATSVLRANTTRKVITLIDINAAIAQVTDDQLRGLAERVHATGTWDDLVLPPEEKQAINDLALRVLGRQRVYTDWGFAAKMRKGLGVVALLSGPPGTGKTLTASALADVVGLPLYRVDSSKITSKWIGETEKKLAELFDAAEACNAVLLFDEADSLFGKRTTVNNGNDRYANQEVNFLLQRLESFTGICVLTTNHENAMDEAFRRRLTAHVRIPMPEAAERSELWRTMLPATAPAAANIDFTWLGDRFELSGGYIRNAVLRAAFMASADGCEIDTERLAQAATTEARGMGKVVRG